MKKSLLFFVFALLAFSTVIPTGPAQAKTIPNVFVYFEGTPQTLYPEIRNSGTLHLTMNLGDYSLENLDNGNMTFRNYDETTTYKVGSLWDCNEDTCELEVYIPIDIEHVYIESTSPILWIGYGPWVGTSIYNGIRKTEMITEIEFSVSDPQFNNWEEEYNPTWDWQLTASPKWAADQWFNRNTVSIDILTNCNGHADNHAGLFYWEEVTTESTFGNGVYRQWLMSPLETIGYQITGEGNWTQTGETLGPTCWNSLIFLPMVKN
jgi:hypothetical protein